LGDDCTGSRISRVRYVLEKLYQALPPEERTNASIIVRPRVEFQLSPALIEQFLNYRLSVAERMDKRYDFLTEIINDPEQAFQRFKTHGIHILASEDYRHFLTPNINPYAATPIDLSQEKMLARLIDAIRNAEIDYLVRVGNCKLPQLGRQYYQAPSRRCMKAFLRVGNLQISRSAIDALFFWLLPYLRNCIGIVTDTWSISSISQNASRLLVEYEAAGKPPCPIEMLGDYHDLSEQYGSAAAETIDRFISRIELRDEGSVGQVLILISATHTGSMVKLIERFLPPRGIPQKKVTFVSIFKLSPASRIPTLRDLSDDEDFVTVDNLSDEQKSAAIKIHPRLYFPITLCDIEKSRLLSVIKPYRDFARRYADISFARVHRTDSNSIPSYARHHAIWIDTSRVISQSVFIEMFREKLWRSIHARRSSFILVTLRRIPSWPLPATVGAIVRAFRHDDLRLNLAFSADDEEIRAAIGGLDESAAILLLDDAFVTGTRINSYQKNLREFDFAGVYHYLVAIARPEADKIWEDQKKAFLSARAPQPSAKHDRMPENSFDFVEKLILPNWAEDRCPWCAEGERFARMRQRQHAAALRDAAEGMDQDIFITPTDHDSLKLKKDSFVGPPGLAQSNVFCTIAGALQRLRTEGVDGKPLLGEQYFLIKPVLNESYYLRYFTDSVLMAAIFRAATADELVYADAEREKSRTRAIRDRLHTKTTSDLACEIAFAESLGKFPQLRKVALAKSAGAVEELCDLFDGFLKDKGYLA
jgi:hypothetical protein